MGGGGGLRRPAINNHPPSKSMSLLMGRMEDKFRLSTARAKNENEIKIKVKNASFIKAP